jgi:hypothetical protein
MKSLRGLAVAASIVSVMCAGCSDDGSDPGFSTRPNTAGETDAPLTDSSGGTLVTPTTSVTTTAEAEDSSGEPVTTGGGATSSTSGGTGPDGTSTSGGGTTESDESTGPIVGGCGNGALDMNEQCDGQNLNGFTCESLGNTGGTLLCDPVTCTFDTSMCSNDTSGGTSG